MNVSDLRNQVLASLWSVVDGEDSILSATLAGSFADNGALQNVSDIDLILILDRLDIARYERLLKVFDEALAPVVSAVGYRLKINPTLGPLKFNDPVTAVLHLMLYTRPAHVDHCIKSPFTCLDWQQSACFRKRPLSAIYPVFGLQPHHFFSARRSSTAYLKDFKAGVISYREIVPSANGYEEVGRSRPMDDRDRHEFAYHIMKFLMQNFVKLVERVAAGLRGDALPKRFFGYLPLGAADHLQLFHSLARRKEECDFAVPERALEDRLTRFVMDFERQFRTLFFEESQQHIFFRHARTAINGTGRFFSRTEAPIEPALPEHLHSLVPAVESARPARTFVSPLGRCQQSMGLVCSACSLPVPLVDSRLAEMDYGACEGLTSQAAQEQYPELFGAWSRKEDPPFPGGENTAQVTDRLRQFMDSTLAVQAGNSAVCTHNVVLRCLVGSLLNVPAHDWFRLRIPHLTPIRVIQSHRFGFFLDLDEAVERHLFGAFAEEP